MATNQGLYYYSKEEIDEKLNYSTEEMACGTWIDGSVIYRKTIVIDGEPNQGVAKFDTGIDNLDKIIKFENIRYWEDPDDPGETSWSQLQIPQFTTNLSNQLGPYNSYFIEIDWDYDTMRPCIVIRTYRQGNVTSRDNTLDPKWHHRVTIYYTKTSS